MSGNISHSDEFLTELVQQQAKLWADYKHLTNEQKSGILYAMIVNTATAIDVTRHAAIGACMNAVDKINNFERDQAITQIQKTLQEAVAFLKQTKR